jgi:ABC-type oligopeptide transport system substrate-binding subunit
MWRETLGVEIELRQIERKVFLNSQSRLDYDISASSWIGDYNDANTFLDMYTSNSGNNRTGWKNARYDDLIRRANMQTDLKRRAELFREAETRLLIHLGAVVTAKSLGKIGRGASSVRALLRRSRYASASSASTPPST